MQKYIQENKVRSYNTVIDKLSWQSMIKGMLGGEMFNKNNTEIR